ncbi:uncharacterized protein LOC125041512 isoform X1 [Penaeus chinensis]|uniref:uncharacterized protein LOC125041512 isoform X1 n=1 Tax=Penaeus chinensis TaxID=139456 RepID=UPI001FB68A92|nr:uncharacterized protein LOC125041512 isoform X1 [Penaeus chinensis]
MRMDDAASDDILTMAQRRQAGRKNGRAPYPNDHVLRIDNFTGLETPAVTPPTSRKYEPKGFIAEIASERRREPRVSVPMFLEEVPYSRNTLPPLVPVEVRISTSRYPMNGLEVAALIHTACHVSFMSTSLVGELSMRQDIIPDTSVPPSPLSSGTGVPWLVEGKLRYVELSLKGSKHVTQLHVARDLPSDLVLGVDFLKKAQVRVNFPENCIFLPNGGQETKVSFLSSKEMNQHQRRSNANATTTPAKTRAYSSNY